MAARSKGLAVLLALAALVLIGIVLLLDESIGARFLGTSGARSGAAATSATLEGGGNDPSKAEASSPLDTAAGAASSRTPGTDDAAGFVLSPTFARASSIVSTGKLRVSGFDEASGTPLNRIRVRAVSETRVADRTSDAGENALELTLTPDTYSIAVLAAGHEPTTISGVAVVADETRDLETVLLRGGSAQILGVVGPGWTKPMSVELLGEGRGPCPDCSTGVGADEPGPIAPDAAWHRDTPCAACGFAAASSRVKVAQDGRFLFSNLAGGAYALRLQEDRGDHAGRSLAPPEFVRLQAHESLVVELEPVGLRTVAVDMLDVDGSSLSSVWAERLRAAATRPDPEQEPEFAVITEPGKAPASFACAVLRDEAIFAESTFYPPPPSSAGGFTILCVGRGNFAWNHLGTDDRARGDSESFLPDPVAPTVEPIPLHAHVDPDGLVRFDNLFSFESTLRMTCGPFTAEVAIPASSREERVRVRLSRVSTETEGDQDRNAADSFREYESFEPR